MSVEVRFLRLPGNPDLPLPSYATASAAGFDLRAAVPAGAPVVLAPGDRLLVDTGFAVAIPDGFEMQVRPRSGSALRHGVTLANAPATIDADYRGPVSIILVNLGQAPFPIARGDRIAQGIVAPVTRVSFAEVDALDDTARGSGGFGSTGRG